MKGATRGLREKWMKGNYLRLMSGLSRRQNELVGSFKMVAGDLVSIRGQVMEYTYIPTEIKREIATGRGKSAVPDEIF